VIQGGGEVARKAAGPVEVSQPNEPAEVEADHVADDVAEGLHGGGGGAGGPPKIAAKLEGARPQGVPPGHRRTAAGAQPRRGAGGRFDFDRKAMEARATSRSTPSSSRSGSVRSPSGGRRRTPRGWWARRALSSRRRSADHGQEHRGARRRSGLWAAQDEVLGKLTGDPTMAGAVPKGTVQEIMMSQQEIEGRRAEYAAADAEKKKTMTLIQAPNLREQMTLVMNFASNILVPGILDDHVAGGSPARRHHRPPQAQRHRGARAAGHGARGQAQGRREEGRRGGQARGQARRKRRARREEVTRPARRAVLGEVPELAGGDAGFAATDDAAGSEDPSALKTTQAVEDQNDVRKNRGDKAKEFGLDREAEPRREPRRRRARRRGRRALRPREDPHGPHR
jgi:hypothetical protein